MRSDHALTVDDEINWVAEAYRDHGSAVFNLAAQIGGRDLADDVTQEVFLRYWRRPERFDPQRGSLRSFLMVMARSATIDMLRTKGARCAREGRTSLLDVPVESTEHQPVWRAMHSDVAERVKDALENLKSAERDAIVLAYYGGLTYKEVAVALNAAEGTVKSRIRTGLQRLAVYMKAHDPDAFRVESA